MDDRGGRIVVVSNEGEFVREFGRLGDGPGEFSASSNTAIGFTVLRDGRVVVFDPGHSVFQVFAPDGEFDRSVRMPGTSMYLIRTLAPARDGQSVMADTWAPSRPMRLRCHQPSVPMDWLLSESGTTSMYTHWS